MDRINRIKHPAIILVMTVGLVVIIVSILLEQRSSSVNKEPQAAVETKLVSSPLADTEMPPTVDNTDEEEDEEPDSDEDDDSDLTEEPETIESTTEATTTVDESITPEQTEILTLSPTTIESGTPDPTETSTLTLTSTSTATDTPWPTETFTETPTETATSTSTITPSPTNVYIEPGPPACVANYEAMIVYHGSLRRDTEPRSQTHQFNLSNNADVMLLGVVKEGHPERGCSPMGDLPGEDPICSQYQDHEDVIASIDGVQIGAYLDGNYGPAENAWFGTEPWIVKLAEGEHTLTFAHSLIGDGAQSVDFKFTVCVHFDPFYTPTDVPPPTFTPTNTVTPSPTATDTNTPIPPTETYTSTATFTNTPIPPTATDTATATNTNTDIPPSLTLTASSTATNTATFTNTPSPTSTDTLTPTPTFTDTSTSTYTPTATFTSTFTPTPTSTYTSTSTNTPTPSNTPIPPVDWSLETVCDIDQRTITFVAINDQQTMVIPQPYEVVDSNGDIVTAGMLLLAQDDQVEVTLEGIFGEVTFRTEDGGAVVSVTCFEPPQLDIDATCNIDGSINFVVSNIGATMPLAQVYQVLDEDGIITDIGTFSLDAGETLTFIQRNTEQTLTFQSGDDLSIGANCFVPPELEVEAICDTQNIAQFHITNIGGNTLPDDSAPRYNISRDGNTLQEGNLTMGTGESETISVAGCDGLSFELIVSPETE